MSPASRAAPAARSVPRPDEAAAAAAVGSPMLSVVGLSARQGSFTLRNVSFDVQHGAYGILIGPAGAGKTTLLEAIAGVIPVREGAVVIGGRVMTHVAPDRRGLSLVYQHAYLFPHLTVRRNIEYGAATPEAAREMSDRFGLEPLAGRDVRTLSGGERQLVALARGLTRRPGLLLLDEPFAALDQRTRNAARRVLRVIHQEQGFTVLHVSHDFSEVGLLGDVAVLLDRGRVLQAGPPDVMFREPASAYVADFLGAENVFAGRAAPIRALGPDWSAARGDAVEEHAVAFTTGAITLYALGDAVPGPAHAVIRAEEVALSLEPGSSSVRNQFRGTVMEFAPAGAITRVTVDVQGTPVVAAVTSRSVQELGLEVGRPVVVAFKAMAVHIC